jgi:hypothetical protein
MIGGTCAICSLSSTMNDQQFKLRQQSSECYNINVENAGLCGTEEAALLG